MTQIIRLRERPVREARDTRFRKSRRGLRIEISSEAPAARKAWEFACEIKSLQVLAGPPEVCRPRRLSDPALIPPEVYLNPPIADR
jgi:hypothetical protein